LIDHFSHLKGNRTFHAHLAQYIWFIRVAFLNGVRLYRQPAYLGKKRESFSLLKALLI